MRRVILFITALLITHSLQAQVSLLGQDIFDLNGTVKKDTINVSLKFDSLPKKKKPILLSDTPLTVRLGASGLDSKYRDAIRVSVDPGEDPSLNIAVDLLKLNKAGTYEVKISYRIYEGERKILVVSLIRPAAVLDTLSTVHININGSKIACDSLLIKETSTVSNINNAKLDPPFFTIVNKNNLISLSFATYNFPAGKVSTISYRPNDELLRSLPLGKTAGKMQLKTPEMATALVVPFEVMNKRSKCWILFSLFTGLLLGALVRHLLKDKKEWEAQKIQGFQLMQKIIEETKKVEDKAFRADIADLLEDLSASLNSKGGWAYFTGNKDVSLADKITAATTAYNTKKTEFDTRIVAQKGIFKQLSGCFENPRLSEIIKSLFAKALVTYNSAKNSLYKLDATQAEIDIQQTIEEINIVLQHFIGYQKSLTALILKDSFYPSAITEEIKTAVKNYATQIQEELKTIAPDIANPETLTDGINKADQIVELKRTMMDYINRSFSSIYNLTIADNPEVIAFKNAFAQWSAALKDIIWNPDSHSDVEVYWSNKLVEALNNTWGAIGTDTVMGDAALAPAIETVTRLTLPHRESFTPADYFNEGGAGLASISVDIQKSKRNRFLYSLLQTFILAAILGLIAYNTYGPSFIGTCNELTTIFLFAFFFDISLDRLMELKNGKIPS